METTEKKDPKFVDYERINEYTSIAHVLVENHGVFDEKHIFLSLDLLLIKIGILVLSEWSHWTWAIPNTNTEIKKEVLGLLPFWAEVVEK